MRNIISIGTFEAIRSGSTATEGAPALTHYPFIVAEKSPVIQVIQVLIVPRLIHRHRISPRPMLVIAAAGFAPLLPPSARVGVAQRVVHAVGVAVEALRVAGLLHVAVDGEERTHHGVVHPAVHVDEAEDDQMLLPGVATVEHGFYRSIDAPRDGVA